MKRVDFHMHTTHSDGTYSPAELMRYCKKKDLACVSVTDHDTMSSFEDCSAEAKKLGIELVPGIEISAIFEPGTLHILGYFLDRQHPFLKAKLEDIQRARRDRNPEIVRRLNAVGIDITLDEVHEEALQGDSPDIDTKQVGRPHFAEVLVKKGVVSNRQEAFKKYLGKGCPAYIDKRRVTGREAIDMIHRAGGVASVAHPKQMKLEGKRLEAEIAKLAEDGLDGIEVFNSCQNPDDNRIYSRLAQQFNLVRTAGSDFHGAAKPGVDLGFMGQDIRIGYDMVDALRGRIKFKKAS